MLGAGRSVGSLLGVVEPWVVRLMLLFLLAQILLLLLNLLLVLVRRLSLVIAQRLLRLVVSFLRSCWKRMVMILLGGSRHGAGWGGIELL
jgi:hypothetical protein